MKLAKRKLNSNTKTVLWIYLCILLILLSCIIFPDFYFRLSDKKTFNTVSKEDAGNINLSVSTDTTMSVYDKMDIINDSYIDTDLNFNYSDEYSYSDVHDIAMNELTDLFTNCIGLEIYIDGIYEMIIEKHLIISETDNSKNFMVWVVDVNYYGFELDFMLDYDTNKILALYMNFNPENNSYYSKEKLKAQDFYSYAVSPIEEFLYPIDGNDNSKRIVSASDEYAGILAAYYEINELISEEISNSDSYTYSYTYIENNEEHFICVNRNDYAISINNY